jgi:hypothetical protein
VVARSLIALALALLAGCGLFPLGEAECRPPDWRQAGYAHGYAGHPAQDLRLVPECRERYGVEVDQLAYMQGWRDGHDEWYRIIGSMERSRRF